MSFWRALTHVVHPGKHEVCKGRTRRDGRYRTAGAPGEERTARVQRLRKVVKEQNIYRWAGNLIADLCEVRLDAPIYANAAKGLRPSLQLPKRYRGKLSLELVFRCHPVARFKLKGDWRRMVVQRTVCCTLGAVVMSDYDNENWVGLYRSAMVELEHAKVAERIGNARKEISARIEELQGIPGPHAAEKQAIDGALSDLQRLERMEERYAQDERRTAKAMKARAS
jgi:hypothetical protein